MPSAPSSATSTSCYCGTGTFAQHPRRHHHGGAVGVFDKAMELRLFPKKYAMLCSTGGQDVEGGGRQLVVAAAMYARRCRAYAPVWTNRQRELRGGRNRINVGTAHAAQTASRTSSPHLVHPGIHSLLGRRLGSYTVPYLPRHARYKKPFSIESAFCSRAATTDCASLLANIGSPR